jgi:hypothetical protein
VNWTDIGYDHRIAFTSWHPDRALNPQYEGIPDVERWGLIVEHKKPDGSDCAGAITFDGEVQQRVHPQAPKWVVESWDPLTVSPSLLCRAEGCTDHGFIRDGRWVPA